MQDTIPIGSPTVAGSSPTGNQDQADPELDTFSAGHDRREVVASTANNQKDMRFNDKTATAAGQIQDVWMKNFHLFYWLAATSKPANDEVKSPHPEEEGGKSKDGILLSIDGRQLRKQTSEIHTYLVKKNRHGRQAYTQCPISGPSEVENRLTYIKEENARMTDSHRERRNQRPQFVRIPSDDDDEMGQSGNRRSSSRGSRENPRVFNVDNGELDWKSSKDIVRLAQETFGFFFPPDYSSDMTGKYWGAIKYLLDVSHASRPIMKSSTDFSQATDGSAELFR